MSVLWTSADATRATGGRALAPFEAQGLSIDTRSIAPGDLFIALKDRRDGHDFVADALAAGAAGALVSRIPDGVAADAPLLLVDDVLNGLRALAVAARLRTRARVIAVTGSVGKTSTKEMLRHVLGAQGTVHAAEKSFNNHWGVPLTLARCPEAADYAVIEIGMSAPGEIAPLARLARPDVAVITTVAAAHLEAFAEGLDGIAREKASIFEGLTPGEGAAVWPADLPVSSILEAAAAGFRSRSFGETSGTDRLEGDTIRIGDQSLPLNLAVPGRHVARNALAAVVAADMAGADPVRAAAAMATWSPPEGRGLSVTLRLAQGVITLLDDAYNANPTSMAAGLDVLGATPVAKGGRRVAILGDMLELGADEAALHAGLAELPQMTAVDCVLCVGPRMAALDAALPDARRAGHVEDAAAAVAELDRLLAAGDAVLVKGSNGSKLSQVVAALRAQDESGSSGQG